jgi:hypothetical protein
MCRRVYIRECCPGSCELRYGYRSRERQTEIGISAVCGSHKDPVRNWTIAASGVVSERLAAQSEQFVTKERLYAGAT